MLVVYNEKEAQKKLSAGAAISAAEASAQIGGLLNRQRPKGSRGWDGGADANPFPLGFGVQRPRRLPKISSAPTLPEGERYAKPWRRNWHQQLESTPIGQLAEEVGSK